MSERESLRESCKDSTKLKCSCVFVHLSVFVLFIGHYLCWPNCYLMVPWWTASLHLFGAKIEYNNWPRARCVLQRVFSKGIHVYAMTILDNSYQKNLLNLFAWFCKLCVVPPLSDSNEFLNLNPQM